MTRFKSQQIPYTQTKAFTAIATDYVANAPALKPFYQFSPDLNGINNAIVQRKKINTNRLLLVQQLKEQYAGIELSKKLQEQINKLLLENTFTITTAHQPNIFTGHLYFIYKILHVIKLAEELTEQLPDCNFVPVYYMGSEDADLEELGTITINGKKYIWETKQTGAVGRMKIDKAFMNLIDAIEGQVLVETYGQEIMVLVRNAYTINKTIEQATFELVHQIFESYALVILLPDNRLLKNEFAPIVRKELLEQFSNQAVAETMLKFPAEYKFQAAGREINLFYLNENSRERIVKDSGDYKVQNQSFTQSLLLDELNTNPERFSPNVILRPVFQEMILPNIAFIGGAGELAYWLELKKVFEAVDVPYPVLVLRNSFMVVNEKMSQKMDGLKLDVTEFFEPMNVVMLKLVKQHSLLQLELVEEKKSLEALYQKIKHTAADVDISLQQHTEALFAKAIKKIEQLEKKMQVAEKKKFEVQQRQVEKIRTQLFPSNSLQERVDNIIPYYAKYGKSFIDMLYQFSTGLQQEFCIVTEEKELP